MCSPSSGAGGGRRSCAAWRSGDHGHDAQLGCGRRSRWHRKKARLALTVDDGMFPAALDPHLDIAAFQLKLGNVLLD